MTVSVRVSVCRLGAQPREQRCERARCARGARVCRLGLHPLLIEARRSGAERISGGLPRPMMYGKCSAPCTGVWPCVITVASTHRHRRCANLCRGKELQRLHLTQECCSVVVILLLTRKPRGKPSTRSHEHNTHPFPLQTGNGAACHVANIYLHLHRHPSRRRPNHPTAP